MKLWSRTCGKPLRPPTRKWSATVILNRTMRPDGRGTTEIRPIWCDVDYSPRAHGSGLFTRGETQVLTIATLGTPRDAQNLDNLTPNETKRYMHHYNFPPFSVGETRPLRGSSRREIGHGALAERALVPVIPDEKDFPYTLRLVSECLSSNGSTSMAIRVRLYPGSDGYRCADQGPGFRHRHGHGQRRR